MSVFPDWPKYAVHQRRPQSGCIPTAYEMILRAAGVQGVDLQSFQDDFDFDRDRRDDQRPQNNFHSVAAAVKAKHPAIEFLIADFPRHDGAGKLAFIEAIVSQGRPVVASIANEPFDGTFHIMPVVDLDPEAITFLTLKALDGGLWIRRISRDNLIRIHGQYEGGHDVAFLGAPAPQSGIQF